MTTDDDLLADAKRLVESAYPPWWVTKWIVPFEAEVERLQAVVLSLQSDEDIARISELEAEIERLQALRCPRCGEWVRDFPPYQEWPPAPTEP